MRTGRGRTTIGAGLGALALAVAGCGADDGDVTATPSPTVTITATETDVPTPEPAETVTLEPVAEPGACDDLVDIGTGLAFVVVEAPAPGDPVLSPIAVRGCANAFEAAFVWELLDRSGTVLAQGFDTASCGTGCVGTFDFEVEYGVDELQVGSLQVFTESAQDGSRQDLNAIPVLLGP